MNNNILTRLSLVFSGIITLGVLMALQQIRITGYIIGVSAILIIHMALINKENDVSLGSAE